MSLEINENKFTFFGIVTVKISKLMLISFDLPVSLSVYTYIIEEPLDRFFKKSDIRKVY